MSEWKEVWYLWDGKGEPPKHFTGVSYSSNIPDCTGGYSSPILESLSYYSLYFDHKNTSTANAVAYTLGEKRRRCTKCKDGLFCCEGMGCVGLLCMQRHRMGIQEMNPISTNHSYDQIEQIIKPYRYSVREEVDPLHLHKYGLPLRKFTAKRDLVSFLNMKLQIERYRNARAS